MTNTPVADLVANKITMTYRNYRGEVSERTITPLSIRWGVTEWHPVPGWLLTAFDHGKQADRDFALADCQFAALTPASAEPVAWRYRPADGGVWSKPEYSRRSAYGRIGCEEQPLYAHPAPVTVEAALLQRAVDLIRGDLVGGEWKKACNEFVKDALRALSGDKS